MQAGPSFRQEVTSSRELNAPSLTVSSGPDFQSAVNWYVSFFTFIIACFHLVYISKCTGFQGWTVVFLKKYNFKKCRLADPMAPGRGPIHWLVGTPWRASILWVNPIGSHWVGPKLPVLPLCGETCWTEKKENGEIQGGLHPLHTLTHSGRARRNFERMKGWVKGSAILQQRLVNLPDDGEKA